MEKGLEFDDHYTKYINDPLDIEYDKRDVKIVDKDGNVVFEQLSVSVPKFWSQNAINIVASKYFREVKDKFGINGYRLENSVREMIVRVVSTITRWGIEQNYFKSNKDADIFSKELCYVIVNQMGTFNSPVWFNVGAVDNPQGSACFINSVKDNMESIMELARTEAMIFKGGSGSGVNFSTLRSSFEKVRGGGNASGPVSFMKGYDTFAGVIRSGGKTRRSAKMAILNIDHPDIRKFIECKRKEERKALVLIDAGYDGSFDGEAYASVHYQNANNSVRVTDEFMSAVVNDEKFYSKSVTTGEIIHEEKARDLFDCIVKSAHTCGDPGLQFDDTINSWNTCSNSGRINASNPCVTGDTLISTSKGRFRIDQLLYEPFEVLGSDGRFHKVKPAFKTGRKPVYELKTTYGLSLKLTLNHLVSTYHRGDISVSNLCNGDVLITMNPTFGAYHKVESVELCEIADVYDITEPNTNHYVANGILVHNCSEFMFIDDSACNLSSINLLKFLRDDGTFAYEIFCHVVDLFITAQDILINKISYPNEKIRKNSIRFRPLGLGYSNLGALLMCKGLPYDSEEGRNYAAMITAMMTFRAYLQSSKIAICKGYFGGYKDNEKCMNNVIEKHIEMFDERYNYLNNNVNEEILGNYNRELCSMYDYINGLILDIAKFSNNYGYRNSQVTLIAPTGTISLKMDCDTTGVEPDIALIKRKNLVDGGHINIVNQSVSRALSYLGYEKEEIDLINSYIIKNGNVEGSCIRDEHIPIFDCAVKSGNSNRYISPEGHVSMICVIQPFLSGAISKTVNMPNSATKEDIYNIYMRAWLNGAKSISIYRDYSKKVQPLEVMKSKSVDIVNDKVNVKLQCCKLSDERKSVTHKFYIANHKGYLTVGLYDDGTPGEIFIKMAKAGSVVNGFCDSFAIAVSLSLQHGVPLSLLVDKYSHNRFEPSGFTKNKDIPIAKSIVDYIFRWMELKFIKKVGNENNVDVHSDSPVCQECGGLMRRSGSCYCCETCGVTSGCS